MRKAIMLIAFSLALIPLSAISWTPSLDISGIYEGTSYSESIDSEGCLRSSAGLLLRIDPAALSVEDHRISMPLSLRIMSQSNLEGRTIVQPRMLIGIAIEYGYAFSDAVSLSASIGTLYEYFLRSSAGRWLLEAEATLRIPAGTVVSALIPFSVIFGKGSASFSIGAGVRIGL